MPATIFMTKKIKKWEDFEETAQMGRYANVTMDRAFKLFFGSEDSKELLRQFLEALIPERKIAELYFIPQEYINPFPEKHNIRIDVHAVDETGASFIVEMQVAEQASFNERAVYYASFDVQRQLIAGKRDDYSFPPVYFIGVMNFSMHKDSDEVLFRYLLKRDRGDEVMTESLQFVFLELPNFKKTVTEDTPLIEKICYAFMNMKLFNERPKELYEEFFKLLFNSAEISKFAPEKHRKYLDAMMTERDLNNVKAFERNKGREEGRAEGEAKGRAEEKNETARKLYALGVDADTISKATGLSESEIKNLN